MYQYAVEDALNLGHLMFCAKPSSGEMPAMADSAPHLAAEIFDQRFKEYQICREEAARLESSIWMTAAVFGVASAVGLAFTLPLAGRVPPLHYARLAVAMVTAFEINASLVWWRFVRRWRSIQSLKYQRMDDLEAELGFRQHSIVKHADEEAMARPHGRMGPRGRTHEYRGSLPAIQFFLCTNALLWTVVLLSEVFGLALLFGMLLGIGEVVLYYTLWKEP
jgi:hypothetical protein